MRRALACLLPALLAAAALFASDAALETRTFSLRHIASKDVFTLLRTIVDVKRLEVIDDATFKATATADRLEMAAQIVALVDTAETRTEVETIADGDEFVIAVAPLRGTSPGDAMVALRKLGIHKIAIVSAGDLVIVRDGEPQVNAALERLETLRQSPPE